MNEGVIGLDELEERLGPQMAKVSLMAEVARDIWASDSPSIDEWLADMVRTGMLGLSELLSDIVKGYTALIRDLKKEGGEDDE